MAHEIWTSAQLHVSVLLCLFLAQRVNGQCGNDTLTLNSENSPQYLTSPNYPGNYPANADCSWRILAPSSDEKIIINIEDYDSESVNSDYMDLYDGYDANATLVIRMAVTNRKNLNAFVSSGDVLFITFVSDYTTQYSGFQILYFSSNTVNQHACNSTLDVTSQEQILMSPNLPQPYNASECSWTFSSSIGILFQLKFLDLGGCLQSYLKIYDGTSAASDELVSKCHTALTYEFDDITTTGFSGHIAFKVTDQPLDYYGFMLVYRTNEVTTTSTTIATTTLAPGIFDNCTASGAFMNASISPNFDYIYSPDYASGAYPSNTYCRWYVTAPDNYAVEAYFDNETYAIESNTYCRYDYVIFYDGDSTTDSMLNKFCGTVRPTTVYRSAGTQMLIVFSSDYIIQRAGFRIRIRAVDNTNPGCKSDYTTYPVLYNRLEDYLLNNYTFINNISSPGFGTDDYPLNIEVFWLFFNANTTGYRIVLDIISISIERSYNCIYDRLVLYNGPCIKDGVLDTVCGYWKKQWDLDGPEYLLHLHSDGYKTQSGFLINYYAEEKAVPIAATTSTTTFGPPVGAVVDTVREMLTNYSNENLPTRDLSEPIRAFVDFSFVGINRLDEVSQKLTSIGQFEVSWEDPSLTWDPTKRQGVVQVLLPQNDLWKPDIALINGFSKIKAMGAKFMFIDINYNGSCVWKPYQVMDSVCQVDLTHFPYDRQVCILKFGTWSSDDSQVITKLGERGLQIHPNFQENAEWRLISTETKQALSNHHKIVEFHITLERNAIYVTYYLTIPIIMLSNMNAFVFVVPCESGEKTGYSVTLFLSFVVLLIINNQSLPDNSDTISLYAAYVLAMTILSAFALIISTIQIRAISFDERMFPISKRIKRVVIFVNKIETLFLSDESDDDTEIRQNETEVLELRPYKKESPTEFGSSGYGSSNSAAKREVVFKLDEGCEIENKDTQETNRFSFPRNQPVNKIVLERQTTLFEENSLVRRSDTPFFEVHSSITGSQTSTQFVEEPSISKRDEKSSNSDISNTQDESDQYSTNEQAEDNDSLFNSDQDEREQYSSSEQIINFTKDVTNDSPFNSQSEISKTQNLTEHALDDKQNKKDADSLFDSEFDLPMTQILSKDFFSLENEENEVDPFLERESGTSVNNDSNSRLDANQTIHKTINENQLKQPTFDSDKNDSCILEPKVPISTSNGSLNTQFAKENELNQMTETQVLTMEGKTTLDQNDVTENNSLCSNENLHERQQLGSLRDEIMERQPVSVNGVKMNRPISATENRPLSLNKYVKRGNLGSASTKHGRALSASSSRPISTKDTSRVVSVLSKRPLSFVSKARPLSEITQNENTCLLFDNEEEYEEDIMNETSIEEVESTNTYAPSSEDFKSSSQTESIEQDENKEDPSWPDLVSCTDIIFFIFYLLVTTILSLAFFITMVLAY